MARDQEARTRAEAADAGAARASVNRARMELALAHASLVGLVCENRRLESERRGYMLLLGDLIASKLGS